MNLPDHLILFDGHCHLCDKSVKTILKFDHREVFHFASLQSTLGKSLFEKNNLTTTDGETIIYFRNKRVLTKSEAALWIAVELNFPVNLIGGLILFPPFVRNATYAFIAKNRYKWFGKSESCLVPENSVKNRFLDL